MGKIKAIGVDIGGTNLRVALVSGDGEVLERVQLPTNESLIADIADAIGDMNDDDVQGIGIAVAGIIDRTSKMVRFSPNLSVVEGADLTGILSDKFGLPVIVDNDANCAALGEKYAGAGNELDSFILLTLGTGIGGGVVIDKELLNIPAELGHITVTHDGRQCTCGNHGCLEEHAAAKGIKVMVINALESGEQSSLRDCCDGNIYRITPKTIHEHAMEGDRLSREILREAGRFLGVGLASLTNIFQPQAFILTGGLTNAWNIYVEEAIKEADKRSLRGLFNKDMVIRSEIREDAGLIGAALHSLRSS
ncbi:MAG: ROK family protein [Nitrospirota bacterium]|nr:MAG: ROK family protein [Nitrospirota bacterium]